jgi:hypothetical protein
MTNQDDETKERRQGYEILMIMKSDCLEKGGEGRLLQKYVQGC